MGIHNDSDSRRLQPLGIAYLQSMLLKNGVECDLLDCNLYDNFKDIDILKIVKTQKYNFVGFSIFSSSFKRVQKIARKIKKYDKNIFLAGGGVHSTICHNELVCEKGVFDFAMRGDGETQLLKLIKDLEKNGKPTELLEGYSYKNFDGKTILSDKIYQENDLSSLPFPTRDDFDKYSKRKDKTTGVDLVNVGVSTSRGCPYSCAFCSIPCMSLKWRGRTPENIAEEIYQIFLKNENIFLVYIDDNFFVDVNRAKNIISAVNAKCKKTIPFSFATRVNQIISAGEDCLQFLKENGCVAVELGIENGSNAVLKRYRKNTTVEENEQALKLLKNVGINIGVDFIMFDRFTTLSEIKENIKFFKDNELWGYYPVLFYKKVIPYPGTRVKEEYGNYLEKDYFFDKDVKYIFKKLIKFFLKFQLKIEKVLENELPYELVVLLKTIPYNYLELLVDNIENKGEMKRLENNFFKSLKNILEQSGVKWKKNL